MDAKTAERAGYKVGDTVRLSVDGPVLTPTISGVFTTDDGNVAGRRQPRPVRHATAQKLFGKPGTYDEIDVKAAAGTSQAGAEGRAGQGAWARSGWRPPPARSSPTTRPSRSRPR
ncbi:hypothetical protein [Streptomyces sp. SLBN-31]|uniref:hypothetical protein n=1 Tax=Streptomyces sp. SLBN-31 TaxID=2768444 RepID=UPI0037D9B476